jgi:hypothetical protein
MVSPPRNIVLTRQPANRYEISKTGELKNTRNITVVSSNTDREE